MSSTAPDPPETALAEFIRSRLERLGPQWAEPEVLQEALQDQRDLWIELYRLDNG